MLTAMASDNLTQLGYPWDYGERRGRDDKPSEFGWGRGLRLSTPAMRHQRMAVTHT